METLAIDKEGNLSDADWATLAKANAIIFGSPTYMGGPAWQSKKIADLIPLLLAGAVTLEVCVIARMALNFANVIALPLLLGVGVAFKIYYIMAWRAGQTGLLQSALTRAIAFSAMTNAVVFGTLLASTHPGMSSLGKLMVMPLVCTIAFAVVFQPVLMGHPREIEAGSPVPERFLS